MQQEIYAVKLLEIWHYVKQGLNVSVTLKVQMSHINLSEVLIWNSPTPKLTPLNEWLSFQKYCNDLFCGEQGYTLHKLDFIPRPDYMLSTDITVPSLQEHRSGGFQRLVKKFFNVDRKYDITVLSEKLSSLQNNKLLYKHPNNISNVELSPPTSQVAVPTSQVAVPTSQVAVPTSQVAVPTRTEFFFSI